MRAYNDSNELYKFGERTHDYLKTSNTFKEYNTKQKSDKTYKKALKSTIDPLPLDYSNINNYYKDFPEADRREYELNFKKPVQPVVYQKSTVNKPTVKKQKATEEQVKPLDRTPKLNKPERVELSMKKPEAKESSEKTEFKQGRKFMKETGLRPGFYKKEELAENSNKKIPIKRR